MKFLTFVLSMTLLLSASAAESKKKYNTTKQAMDDIFQSFVNLIPYSTDEMKWKDPNARAYIQGNLSKISEAFKSAKHLSAINLPGFRPSFDVVREHLEATIDAFNSNHKIFARTRLKATTQICLSCHSQLPQNKSQSLMKLVSQKTRNDFATDFEYAEFLFLVRDYPKAVRYYDSEIQSRIKLNKDLKNIHNNEDSHYLDFSIEQSLRKVLTIYTKVDYAPQKAIDFLDGYKNQPEFNAGLIKELNLWIKDLKTWQASKFDKKLKNNKELDAFIAKHLAKFEKTPATAGGNDVTLLIANGALYSFLNAHAKSDKVPEVLFWLAETDKVLNQSYFFSLSDIYLRECVSNYPRSPFAKKCYKSYEDSIFFGYTGSSGTHVPKEELEKLEKLKSYLE